MKFLQSSRLQITHGMFDRHHGTSLPPYSSLNSSYGVGDKSNNVEANRQRIKNNLNIRFLLSARQVHGSKVHTDSKITDDREVDGYDALITNQLNVGLLIQQADCQALLLHDPVQEVIAAIHCGWRGNVANIIKSTIVKMREEFQVSPAHLNVAISPSLGPCCAEFINYQTELPEHLHTFQVKPNHFDLWEISSKQLVEAGVKPSNIDVTGVCTCCNSDYFSYRRAVKQGDPITGRQASVICLS